MIASEVKIVFTFNFLTQWKPPGKHLLILSLYSLREGQTSNRLYIRSRVLLGTVSSCKL